MQSESWLGDPVNGRRARYTRIGTVTTDAPKEHVKRYETASWWTAVEVPAGTYDVLLYQSGSIDWVLVKYAGTVTDEHFVNRLGASSSIAPKRNIGKPEACTAQMYRYNAAEMFATDPRWQLADDWRLSVEERAYSDGRPYASFALVAPEETA